jgi:hypothetical protein
MITYPVDVENTRWAVLKLSTGEIISRNQTWPRADGGEISGLDPDYVYLLHVEDTRPDYDSRIYSLVGTETVDADANEIRKTWETVKRPDEEIKVAIENVENDKFSNLAKIESHLKLTTMLLGGLMNYELNLQNIPPRFMPLYDDYVALAIKLYKNSDVRETLAAQVDAGEEPDIDAADWEG